MSQLPGVRGLALKIVLFFVLASLSILTMLVAMATSSSASIPTDPLSRDNLNDLALVPQLPPVTTGTYQDFDQPNVGATYVVGSHANLRPPEIISGGPLDRGAYMRLSYTTPVTRAIQNSIAFSRTNPSAYDLIVADFDFRMTPPQRGSIGIGRADGFGFALLNTARYGVADPVAPETPYFAAEEPNFENSIGVGFDIYRNLLSDLNNNHISVHFNRVKVGEFDATNVGDLANGQWIHARIIMRPGGGHSDVTIALTPCGGQTMTVVDQFKIPGFTPYEGRVYLAARSGGESADHDIDNINVQYLSQSQSAVMFAHTCQTTTEVDRVKEITITRIGNLSQSASVNYTTMNVSAIAGADYTPISGTLTFTMGESQKYITVPILNDNLNEGDESFLVSLSNPDSTVIAGPSTTRVTIVNDERGLWSPVINLPIVPIHMSLLPDSRLLMWDRHSHTYPWNGDPRLWDLTTNTVMTTTLPGFDIFCSGHSFLPDGRLFVTGGHIADLVGEDKARIYDPYKNSWESVPNMNAGRWYPSNVTLANGDVVVMGGTISPTLANTLTQVWQSSSNTWRNLDGARLGQLPDYADIYPWNFLAPNGRVFVAGPQKVARYLDVTGSGTWIDVASSTLQYRDYGSAVMFGNGKIMIVGGNPLDPNLNTAPTVIPSASAEVIDFNVDTPSWRTIQPMITGRRQHTATALPDGTVLVTGGSRLPGFDNADGAVLTPELYNPVNNTWTAMAPHTRYRGYHSNAMLLPDGRVLIAGGGHPDPHNGREEKNAEIFSPPYLFKATRPVIQCAPYQVTYDRPFLIMTTDDIAKVTLIRLPSITHGFNQNQIYHELTFTLTSGGLQTSLPANPNLVPPGHYMLFIVNGAGTPSVAKIVQVGSIHQSGECAIYLPLIYLTHSKTSQ